MQLAETLTGVFPGVALDNLHLTARSTCAIMAGIATGLTALWVFIHVVVFVRGKRGASYELLDEQGDDGQGNVMLRPSQGSRESGIA